MKLCNSVKSSPRARQMCKPNSNVPNLHTFGIVVHNTQIWYKGTHIRHGAPNFYNWYEIVLMVDCGAQQVELVQTYARVVFLGIRKMFESKGLCGFVAYHS